jgi:multiple sugar transport system substrate-binding protein
MVELRGSKLRYLRELGFIPVLLVASILAVAGCGNGPVDSRRHIVFLYPIEDDRSMVETLIRRFGALHPEIALEVRAVPGNQYQAKIKTLVAAGEPPDVFVCGDVTFPYLRPFVADLSDLCQRDGKDIDFDDFYPAVRKAFTIDRRIYFLPQAFNVSLLYYNKRLFRESREPLPSANWTWSNYADAGRRLTKRDSEGRVTTWGSTITTGWWGEWLTLVHGAGGDFFNQAGTVCTLDTVQALQGLTFYRDKIFKNGFAPTPGEGAATGFRSNTFAMEFGGHTGNWKSYRQISDLDWDIEALPKGPSGRRGGELSLTGLGIAKKTKDREAAWQFIKYMSSKPVIEAFARFGYPAARKSVADMPFYAHQAPLNKAALERAMESAEPDPDSPDFMEIALDLVQPEIDEMLSEDLDPQRAALRATHAADSFLKTQSSRGTP